MSPKPSLRTAALFPKPKFDEMNHLEWAAFLVGNVVLAVVGTVVGLILLTIIVGLADGH